MTTSNNILADQAACRKFYKALDFALNVCVSQGWAAVEEHIARNFGSIEFVGMMNASEFASTENPEIIAELQYAY